MQKLQFHVANRAVTNASQEFVSSPIREIAIPKNNSNPLAITTDSKGTVWFAETTPPSIESYNPTTQAFRVFPIPTTNNCGLIWFLILDGIYLWFSCGNLPFLWSFSLITFHFANFSTGNPNIVPYSLALDSKSSQIWFTSIYTDQIGAFNVEPTGTATLARTINLTEPTIIRSTAGPKYGPAGIAIDSTGNLFITETFAASIVEYDQTAQDFIKYWKLQPGAQPVGVAVDDSAENIWFTNHGSSQFGKVDEKTGAISYFTTSLFSYNYTDSSGVYEETLPYWIQQSPNGAIWLDEHVGNKIARFNSTSGELTEFVIPTADSSPLRFDLNNRDGIVWFTEFQGNRLGMLDENQTCSCDVKVSPRETSLTGQTTNLTINFIGSDKSVSTQSEPLVSGSFSNLGYITSNLTISFRQINSTSYEALVGRGPDLTYGNFSLTFCLNDNNSKVRQCAVALLSVQSRPNISQFDYLLIVVFTGLVAVSLTYLIRRRKRKQN